MRSCKRVRLTLRSLLLRRHVEAELEEELQYHLGRQIRENIAAGLTEHEAERLARVALHGIEQQKELCREARTTRFVEDLFQDIRYALRVFSRSAGFSLIIITTLALGIGANTAIFSLLDATMLRPLPYPDADRLVAISEANRKGEDLMVSWPDFVDYRKEATSFSAIAALGGINFNLTGGDQPERLHGLRVSASFLSVLGVRPMHGRDFLDSDDRPGAVPVAMLSNELWKHRFASDPRIIGSNIDLDGRTFSVIGVLAPTFRFLYARDIYIPIGLDADKQPNRGVRSVARVLARLKPNVSIKAAATELTAISQRLEHEYPEFDSGIHPTIRSFAELVAVPAERALVTLSIGVALLLLIACANVASLLLSRASVRQPEIAIRVAIGASRGRLILQLLTESGLLAFAGAVSGCALAAVVLPGLAHLMPTDEGEMEQYIRPTLSLTVLMFTMGLTAVTTVLVGLVPAMRMSIGRTDPLQSGARVAATGFRGLSFRNLLVTAQIALAMILLTGSGLLLQSLLRLRRTNMGFRPDHLLTVRLKLPSTRYTDTTQRSSFFRRLIDELNTLPGVVKASAATCLPFGGRDCWPSVFFTDGQPTSRPEDMRHAHFNAIDTRYLNALQIPLIRGRDLTEHDDLKHERIVLVNESFVRRFLPRRDPLGSRIFEGYGDNKNGYRIVGVVGDARRESPDIPPEPEVFLSMPQVGPDAIDLVIRTNLPNPLAIAPEIAHAARQLDPDIPLYDFRTMKWYFDYQIADRRFPTFLLCSFAAIAVLVAGIGLYGLISYFVSQRTKEIGIRLALGAQTGDVVIMVVKQGLQLVVGGLLVGIAGAWALTRFITALLFAIRPNDISTLLGTCGLFVAVAALACWLPARRAADVDPALTLRVDQ